MAFNYSFYSSLSCIFAILSTIDFVLIGILIRNIVATKNTYYKKENKIAIICFIALFFLFSFSSALFSGLSYSAKSDLIKFGLLTCRETEHYNVYCNLTNKK